MNKKLISCETCTKEIAASAETCPSCGAENTWKHPEVKRFLENCDKINSADQFNFWYGSTYVHCKAETKTARLSSKVSKIGMCIALAGGVVFFVATSLGVTILLVGVLIGLLGTIINSNNAQFETYCKADFSSGELIYETDDKEHWLPVENFFKIS